MTTQNQSLLNEAFAEAADQARPFDADTLTAIVNAGFDALPRNVPIGANDGGDADPAWPGHWMIDDAGFVTRYDDNCKPKVIGDTQLTRDDTLILVAVRAAQDAA